MSSTKMKESAKMKGLLKGLRYISQIFDEEKDEEMQIGLPTDVKHVAHIGWDGPATGPAVDSSPSWMKEFSSTTGFSAPLGPPPDSKEGPEIKWVSEDSKRGQNRAAAGGGGDSPKKDHPDLPRSTRRHHHHHNNNSSDSPKKTKTRQSRRQQAKDALDSVLKSGSSQESTSSVPGVPRKSRRKKSKEVNSAEGSTKSSRTKGSTSHSTENVLDPDLNAALPKDRE